MEYLPEMGVSATTPPPGPDGLLQRVRLNLTEGIGSRLARRLRAHLGGWKEVFRATERELLEVPGIGRGLARRILREDLEKKAALEIERARRAGWAIDTPGLTAYPELLAETYDPPLILYRKGELLPQDSLAIAIVGARRATPYGIRQAERFARDLASDGWTIVSGMARGIDTAAHWAALRAGGRTIAVMGSGFDIIYPRENDRLVREIARGQGAVLTEFPAGALPLKGNFPRRNRVISGLSRGVLVVEASEKSGALITARWAADENRDVFAVPGSIETGRSHGCHALIRDGARLVQDVRDILGEMPESGPRYHELPREAVGPDRVILDVLGSGEMTIDEIGEAADICPSDLAVCLLRLEISGRVRRYAGKRFALIEISGVETPGGNPDTSCPRTLR